MLSFGQPLGSRHMHAVCCPTGDLRQRQLYATIHIQRCNEDHFYLLQQNLNEGGDLETEQRYLAAQSLLLTVQTRFTHDHRPIVSYFYSSPDRRILSTYFDTDISHQKQGAESELGSDIVFAPSLLEMRYINFPSFFLLSQLQHTSQTLTLNLHSQPVREIVSHQSSFNNSAREHTTTMPPHQMTKGDASQIQSSQVTSL